MWCGGFAAVFQPVFTVSLKLGHVRSTAATRSSIANTRGQQHEENHSWWKLSPAFQCQTHETRNSDFAIGVIIWFTHWCYIVVCWLYYTYNVRVLSKLSPFIIYIYLFYYRQGAKLEQGMRRNMANIYNIRDGSCNLWRWLTGECSKTFAI